MDTYVVIGAFLAAIPMVFYLPFFLPRLKRARSEYLIQSYMKKKFFEEELKLDKKKPMNLRDMKKILKKMQD